MHIPADVPQKQNQEFIRNYQAITKNTDRLLLFAGDQKIEHLDKDFYGELLPAEVHNPTHLFELASQAPIGVFATQLGLIARYGKLYQNINYLVKLNSKTDIIPKDQKDPLSTQLWSVSDVIRFKQESQLSICAVGYTVYLGSEFEHVMLEQAAHIIAQAHQAGLITILWMYPRGKFVKNEQDFEFIAGAAGVANCLGADFAKINVPESSQDKSSYELLKIITQAAGNTKVICAGGKSLDSECFLRDLYSQLTIGNTAGCATGRNIYQKPIHEALLLTKAMSALIYDNADLETALKIINYK